MNTLRAQLTAGITVLVGFTLLAVWLFGSGRILRPFSQAVFAGFVKEAIYVADRVDEGADPHALGEKLGLDVHVVGEGEPPPPPPGAPPIRPRDRSKAKGRDRGRDRDHDRGRPRLPAGQLPPHIVDGLTFLERDGRRLAWPPGPRDRILVKTERKGWVMVRRDLDLGAPRRQLALFLLIAGLVIVLVASGIAAYSTGPLLTARAAMRRIADGDLDHRLDENGPEELAAVAMAFNQMADRIDKMLRTERELLAGISHELRTPISRMHLELELLSDAGASESRIQAMRGDLHELEELISELLELSKMQLGDTALNRQLVDLETVCRNAVEHAAIDNPVAIEGRGVVDGDQVLLERAVANVLQNAGRYASGTPVTITLEGMRIIIDDGGPGVAEEMLPRLFDPFWRAEGSRSKNTGGIGLGGMIVRQVAELHHGQVWAENRPEGGLRVVLDLKPKEASV